MDFAELYVIGEGRSGPIKIGRSKSARARLAALQTGNPRRLKLLASYRMEPDSVSLAESYLHEELSRFAMMGEWFDLDASFIAEYMPDFMLSNGFEVLA